MLQFWLSAARGLRFLLPEIRKCSAKLRQVNQISVCCEGMVNWVELKTLRDEIDGFEARGLLTYDEFQSRFELARGYCKDTPRVLEALIRRAPTEWLDKHLFVPG